MHFTTDPQNIFLTVFLPSLFSQTVAQICKSHMSQRGQLICAVHGITRKTERIIPGLRRGHRAPKAVINPGSSVHQNSMVACWGLH